ncbi:MAG: response regulator [Thermodesulfobacteriota bacterium]
MPCRRSLFWRILFLVSLVLATAIASYGWLVSHQQGEMSDRLLAEGAAVTVRNMAEHSAHHLVVEDFAALEHFLLRAADHPDIDAIRLCEPDGALLVDIVRNGEGRLPSCRYGGPPMELPAAVAGGPHQIHVKAGLVAWHPVRAGTTLGYLQVSFNQNAAAVLHRGIWTRALLAAVVWILAGIVLFTLALRPSLTAIRRLAEFARGLDRNKGARVDVASPIEEIAGLAAALNHASADLVATETALRRERERLAVTLKGISDAVFACDQAGRILLMNEAAESLTGKTRERALGLPLAEILQDDGGVEADIAASLPPRADHPLPSAGIQCRIVDSAHAVRTVILQTTRLGGEGDSAVGTVVILRDVTDRVRMKEEKAKLEKQLRQAQKMEAIGTLAGGIAHDFNNILTAIQGYAELAQHALSEDSPVRRYLRETLAGCYRARDLVRQILAFSRQTEQEKIPVRMQAIVKEALKLLRPSLPATIDIKTDISPDCGTVLASPTEIHQILMNLCVNAYHAMREKGGILQVGLMPVVLDRDAAEREPAMAAGRYVRLEVSDTGHGMEPAVLERIFEPYFTTKEPGEGTGMGLAVVHGIVARSGGHVTVRTTPGEGSVFRVYLPLAEDPEGQGPDSAAEGRMPPGGSERILLVEDDPALLGLGREVLADIGYRVLAQGSSGEALAWFRLHPGECDLVLTDMTMPGMTGLEMATAMLALRPELPIILCSGYSEKVDAERAKKAGIREYVVKPFDWATMAARIRGLLDAGNQRGDPPAERQGTEFPSDITR